MAGGGGMVAVVRALKDAGLAVTLMDSGREYSLVPDSEPGATHPAAPTNYSRHAACQHAVDTGQYTSDARQSASRRESGVQATDGRYASTYKMTHCHLTPTSPPDLVTEFPPQKTELCPGHENFVIGGTGSGDTYSAPARCSSFRGGLCWPDRGSVFVAKPSAPADSFSSSLRRYPLPQQRSSEVVERLISYTQAKHSSLRSPQSNMSPTRGAVESKYQHDHEVITAPKRLEESPTRDKRRGPIDQDILETLRKSPFGRTNEIRCLKDVSRKVRDGLRNLSHQANTQHLDNLNKPLERCQLNVVDKKIGVHANTNSVNMEIQAAVPMVSREIVTMPLPVPSQRTIATPLTPSPSRTEVTMNTTGRPSDIAATQITVIRQSLASTAELVQKSHESHEQISPLELKDKTVNLYKESKSQEEIRIMENEVSLIPDSHLKPHSNFYAREQNITKKDNKFIVELAENFKTISKSDRKFYEYSHLSNKDPECFRSFAKVIQTEVGPGKKMRDEGLADILGAWLDQIPLKLEKQFEKMFDNKIIFNDFLECLQNFTKNVSQSYNRDKLKSDILYRLDSLPVEVKGNKRIVLSRFADLLINKVIHMDCEKHMRTNSSKREIEQSQCFYSSTYVAPHEVELKQFISVELLLYLEKTGFKINRRKISDLENDLLDCFKFFMEEMHCSNYKRVKKNVIKILRDYGLSEYQATHFANLLIPRLKESFLCNTAPPNLQSETFIVLSNKKSVELTETCHAGVNCKSIKQKHYNLDDFNIQLCSQIDEWLSSLNLQILENTENGFRKTIINDLAKDISDRKKYLELNPIINAGSDEAELEYLRYQIFKWIGKLVGEDNSVPKDHALELMKRIKRLNKSREITKMNSNSVTNISKRPLGCDISRSDINISIKTSLSEVKHGSITDAQTKRAKTTLSATISNSSRQFKVMTISQEPTNSIFRNFDNKVRCTKNSEAISCIDFKKSGHRLKTVKQLEAEYEQFVRNWVQKVPISASSHDQGTLVERARIELQNTLWKIVSKLNCDPATYYNKFFYEDLLDDAIEDLLDALPQTPEMSSTRELLKIEFIEKTVSINDRIKAYEEASYKNKLIKSVITNLHSHGIVDETIRQHEELHIKKIVEAFILHTNFKNDKLVSSVFKIKLAEDIKDFIDNLKKNHVRELGNVDGFVYRAEIMNALEKVPLASERLLREEADGILLGMEVEQWYIDLPTVSNKDDINSCQKKQELEILANKIKEIEVINKDDSSSTLRDEVSRFLNKEQFHNGESAKINYMTDALVNRIKNMKKQDANQNAKRVVFQAPDSYDEFGKNVPLASSYIETSPENIGSDTNSDENQDQVPKCNKSCEACLKSKNCHDHKNDSERSITFANDELTNPSYHEPSDQWQSLRDSLLLKPNQNASSVKQYTIPETCSTPPEYEQVKLPVDEEKYTSRKFYSNPNAANQRDLLNNNNQTKFSFHDKDLNFETKDENKTAHEGHLPSLSPRKVTTSEKMQGSQEAGPSGHRSSYLERFESPQYPSQSPYTSIYRDDYKGHPINQSSLKENTMYSTPETGTQQSLKRSSIAFRNKSESKNANHTNPSVATDTLAVGSPNLEKPRPEYTEPNIPLPSLPNGRKRPKWSISESIKKRLSSDDDLQEDYQCRCIERYWKYRRWPKIMPNEEFDDYPPCFPMFIPCPCFL